MKIDQVRKRLDRLKSGMTTGGRVYFVEKIPEGWEVRHPMTNKTKKMTEKEYQAFLNSRETTDTVFFFSREILD